MRVTVHRIHDTGKATIGYLLVDGKYFCWTLEDEGRKAKIKGETRIWEGVYKLGIRKDDTPLTVKHRQAYGSWFKYHIEILNIRDFTGVYIHAGNDETHTDGCLLLGDMLANPIIQPNKPLTASIQANKRFYELVYPKLEKGEEVTIEFVQVY
jgi:hypothetical protein